MVRDPGPADGDAATSDADTDPATADDDPATADHDPATPTDPTTPDDGVRHRARLGADGAYPFDRGRPFGRVVLGGAPRGPTLDRLMVLPPLFTPRRLGRMTELGREPLFTDVDTRCTLGGLPAALPLSVGAMGSTDVANRYGPAIAKAAAEKGLVLAVGENVATVRGYGKRRDPDQPCLKERALAYLETLADPDDPDAPGGILFQQSVEDAAGELWNRIHADPELTPYLDAGRIGFEVKAGQGAKPGLGGAIRVPRERALELVGTYHFPKDPRTTDDATYERHSAPGTFTPEILKSQLRLMRNNYPKARVWLKLAPFRDVVDAVRVASEAGVDAVTIDGAEAGTAMAPTAAMEHAGLPTLACLARLRSARVIGGGPGAGAHGDADADEHGDAGADGHGAAGTDGPGDADEHGDAGGRPSVLLSGGIRHGADVVKALALGADGCAAGRAFVLAAEEGGADGVARYVDAVATEVRMLVSATGSYRLADLSADDVGALDRDVAEALGVAWVMG